MKAAQEIKKQIRTLKEEREKFLLAKQKCMAKGQWALYRENDFKAKIIAKEIARLQRTLK